MMMMMMMMEEEERKEEEMTIIGFSATVSNTLHGYICQLALSYHRAGHFFFLFLKIYCKESMHSMFKDKLQNCPLNQSE